jgi:phosphotransferase system enzyme I (PtsP)
MAADPAAAILLLAMGFDGLSMNSSSLPRVKWVVRQFSMSQARKILSEVLEMDNSALIRFHLERALDNAGLGGLIRAGKS